MKETFKQGPEDAELTFVATAQFKKAVDTRGRRIVYTNVDPSRKQAHQLQRELAKTA